MQSSISLNPLEKALFRIGREMDLEFVFTKTTDLASICESSRIRMRKIILEKDWVHRDFEPMLCFFNGSPVAYINKKIFLPSGEILKTKELDPIAYMFYRPLSSHITTGWQVWKCLFMTNRKLITSLILYGLIASLIAFIPPIATSFFFKYAIPLNNTSLIAYLFFGLVFSAIGFVLFCFLRNFCFLRFEGISIYFVQTALWDRLLKLPPHFFRKFSAGALFWKMNSVESIRQLIRENASYTILNGCFSFLYLLIMWVYSPLLTAVSGALALFCLCLTLFLMRVKADLLRQDAPIQENLQSSVIQIVAGICKLRTTGSEKSAFTYWVSQFVKSKALQVKAQHIQNIVSTYTVALPIFSMWAIYFLLIEFIGVKNLPLPDFLAFNIAWGSFSLAIYPLNETLMSLVAMVPLWERTKVILQAPPEETQNSLNPGKLSGKIHVDEVSFSYDSSENLILNNISLTVHPGEFIGIAGATGSGKSTLLRLLLGFEKPSSGIVYYDDKSLPTLDIRLVRKQIGTVLQTSGIISGTIYENLVGGGFYTPEEIKNAIESSGFGEDLRSFPMGLHTYVPSNGTSLSGGQKQRLLLARALIGSPSLLIFDEATSSLDNRTQRIVTQNVDLLKVSRIVVAQRLSTIQHADRIYVIDKGAIVQTGTFNELSKCPGIFYEMYERQRL